MEKMTREEVINYVKQWKEKSIDLHYEKVDLRDKDLSHLDLSQCDLSYCLFVNSNLTEANLSNSNLEFTNFYNANLTGANLSGANLFCSSFVKANLHNTQFEYTCLTECDLPDYIEDIIKIKIREYVDMLRSQLGKN